MKYLIKVFTTLERDIFVEADSDKEAGELAHDIYWNYPDYGETVDIDYEIKEVEE